jgi:oligosaccharide repeat unit polymerase
MSEISDKTYYIVIIGILGFLIGNVISACIKLYKESKKIIGLKRENKNEIHKFNINWGFANIILLISLSGTAALFLVTLKYLLSGYSFLQIHNMFYAYGENNQLLSGFFNDYVVWIAVPCLYVSLFVALVGFFEKKAKKIYLLGTITSMLFYLVGNASRFVIVTVLVSIVVLIFYYKPTIDKKVKKNVKQIFIGACIVFIFLMLVRTRTSTNRSVNSIYAYLSIPIGLLDYWVNWFDSVGNSYAYGGGFLFGIIAWINWFTSKLGFQLSIYSLVSSYVINTQNVWVNIFPTKSYNAFCTMFYYFYFDFGMIGVVLESIIFGYMCHNVYYKSIIKNDKNNLLLYLLFIQCILFSFVRWQIGTANFIVEYIAIKILISKIKIKV